MATIAEQVAKDLRAKMRLEAELRPKVNALFKRMVNAHTRSVATTGMPLNAKAFQSAWADMLFEHYQLTQAAFKGSVATFQKKALTPWYIKQVVEGEAPTSEELLAGALLGWATQQAPRQAEFITVTSNNNVADAMRQARESLLEDGESLDDRSMAATSKAILARSMSGRVGSIVMTETQSAAENAKNMEAYSLSDIDPILALGGAIVVSTTTKIWQDVGDKKVRATHGLGGARGQIRLLHEPFDVGGEKLRYPGDSGLGATPQNTANCRCSSIYRI